MFDLWKLDQNRKFQLRVYLCLWYKFSLIHERSNTIHSNAIWMVVGVRKNDNALGINKALAALPVINVKQ